MKIHCHLINLLDKAYMMLSGQKSPTRTQSLTILNVYEMVLSYIIRTQISWIRGILSDIFNPCASASSAQSVFRLNKIVKRVSAFICVYLRLIKISGIIFYRFVYAEVV